MHNPIQYGIRHRRVANYIMPFVNRQLAHDDAGAKLVAILHHFQQILSRLVSNADSPKSSRFSRSDLHFMHFFIASVSSTLCQFFENGTPLHTDVSIFTQALCPMRRRDNFYPLRQRDYLLMGLDPTAFRQIQYLRFVQVPLPLPNLMLSTHACCLNLLDPPAQLAVFQLQVLPLDRMASRSSKPIAR